MPGAGFTVTADHMVKVAAAVKLLAGARVFVGIPAGAALRRPEPGEPAPPDNALLGYVHEHGAPEINLPARPWLKPSITAAKEEIAAGLKIAGKLALDGRPEAVERQLHRVGLKAASAAKLKIRTGPFLPLQPETIAARRRRSAGSRYRRKATGPGDVTPLVDTSQMLNSVTYVIRRAGH